MSNRSVQAGFNKQDMASFQIVIPHNAIFTKYQGVARSFREIIYHYNRESRILAATRDVLLLRLMSGKIGVEEIKK